MENSLLYFPIHLQWWTQDFLDGDGDGPLLPKGGYQPIILAIFPGRLHELLDIKGGYTSWPKASILSLHLPLYSAKPQQSMRQRRPFSNDNETNAHKS